MSNEKEFEKLVARREEIQKRKLTAYSMGLGEHIHQQLDRMMYEIDLDISMFVELRRAKAIKDTDIDGLIV